MSEVKRFTGRVYKISNDIDDLLYVGSTTTALSKRMWKHRDNTKLGKQSCIYKHMREIGVEHFKIVLLEMHENITKEELRAIEDKYIKELDTVANGLNGRYECGWKCEHGKLRWLCKICDGSQICEHKNRKYRCKECNGSQICEHNKRKYHCKICNGNKYHCDICDKTYCSKSGLNRHFKSKAHIKKIGNKTEKL